MSFVESLVADVAGGSAAERERPLRLLTSLRAPLAVDSWSRLRIIATARTASGSWSLSGVSETRSSLTGFHLSGAVDAGQSARPDLLASRDAGSGGGCGGAKPAVEPPA